MQELEAEKKEMEEMDKKKKKGLLFGLIPQQTDQPDTEGSFELSFAGLFRLMCCVKEKPNDTKMQLDRIFSAVDRVSNRIDSLERLNYIFILIKPTINVYFIWLVLKFPKTELLK